MNSRALLFATFFGCSVLLTYGLFRPAPPPDLGFDHYDKLWHVLAFGALGLTARLAFVRVPGWALWGMLFLVALLAEWLQSVLQPVRHFSWLDVWANGVGVGLALMGWVWVRSRSA